MFVVYWDKTMWNRFTIEVRFSDGEYAGFHPSECQWIIPGTVGVDD